MKITILHNERTSFDIEKSGFCLLIEFDNKVILFDTGLKNDISNILDKTKNLDIDFIVLSHGHIDHTEGLKYLSFKKIKKVICHPKALEEKRFKSKNIGLNLSIKETKKYDLITTNKIMQLSNNIFFLGEIPRKYEKVASIEKDAVLDDTGLVFRTTKGLVLVIGCGHSGLKNITKYIHKNFKDKLYAIIGGFHLLDDNTTTEKILYLIKNYKKIYPMHCINNFAIDLFKKYNIDKIKAKKIIKI
ncbi:hypothetical protein COV93_06060 [Candidatus Woesearchaeota archaeon CG11_big_fil_rev_8_21_14_0_20_43_8]|nr:MAG: hypothetical protein COV93_06060 [Candidatus Woesearchaeota archaeon CG11_big_fil_rev_8_21_14_0_20_43_8]